MIMKKFLLYMLLMAFAWTGCQTEEIVEPEVPTEQNKETEFGQFNVEVPFVFDTRATLQWNLESAKGRFDIYLDDVLVGTQQASSNASMMYGLVNLEPSKTYRAKVRWIVSEDEVKFSEVSFTTRQSFLQDYGMAFVMDKYTYTDYEVLSALPKEDGTLYTLSAKKDFGYNTWVVLLKTDIGGEILWAKEYPLSVEPHFSEYRTTELLEDGSSLLLTTKCAIRTSAGGQEIWKHEFLQPEDKKLFLNDACLMDNGNLMVVGSSRRNWGQDDHLWEEAYVAVVSPQGTLLHETFHDLHKQNRLDRIEPMADGNFLVGGVSGEDLGVYMDGAFCTYFVDASAAVLKVEEYPDYPYQEVICSLKDEAGNFYFLGRETRRDGGYYATRSSIIRISPEGQFVSRNCYDRAADNTEVSPVSMNLQDGMLVITTRTLRSTEVLVTDKECHDKYYWGVYQSPYFVYVEFEDPYLKCIDSYGIVSLFHMDGYKEYPYFDFME